MVGFCSGYPPFFPFSVDCAKVFILFWTGFREHTEAAELSTWLGYDSVEHQDCGWNRAANRCSFWLGNVHGGQCAVTQERNGVAATRKETGQPLCLTESRYEMDGTNDPQPRFDWSVSFVPRNQPRQSDGVSQSHTQRRAPHRRCSPVASRERRRVATPFRFPIRVGALSVLPNLDHNRRNLGGVARSPGMIAGPRKHEVNAACPHPVHTHGHLMCITPGTGNAFRAAFAYIRNSTHHGRKTRRQAHPMQMG